MKNEKRIDYIIWDSYFYLLPIIACFRSKDPSTRNGAVIIDNETKHPVSLGYNGFPRGCDDECFPWGNLSDEDNKYLYVEHAERNAIYNAEKSLRGCSLYLYSEKGYYPCTDCTKGIIQSGIKEVNLLFFDKDVTGLWDNGPSKRMLSAAGIDVTSAVLGENIERIIQDFEQTSININEIAQKLKKLMYNIQ